MNSTYYNALSQLRSTGPEFGAGLSNHGQILAAALVSINRAHEVRPWVTRYARQLEPRPSLQGVLNRQNWKTALGDRARYWDWSTFLHREISDVGWEAMLKEWAPRLIAGLSGAAAHGIIRTAAVLVQMERHVNDRTLAELSEAIAYWAVSYHKLPGIGAPAKNPLRPQDALARITWMHKGQPQPPGLIDAQLRTLSGYPPFTGVLNLIRIPDNEDATINDIIDSAARLLLSHGAYPDTLIPYMHGIISASAIRILLPYLKPDDRPRMVRYGWQFLGALYAVYGQINPLEQIEPPSEDLQALIDLAIESGDEHAVIIVDVCLRELRHKPQLSMLAATWDAVRRLSPDYEAELTPVASQDSPSL
ncbi:MAG: DUF4243 domain-containing protein [Candidatus Marinimicrobia bacterium]|nr:DUF4243 domain-containing protein [Candidatus Neomarinimicrobiota bacterium]